MDSWPCPQTCIRLPIRTAYEEETVVAFNANYLPKGLYQVLPSDGKAMVVGSFVRL